MQIKNQLAGRTTPWQLHIKAPKMSNKKRATKALSARMSVSLTILTPMVETVLQKPKEGKLHMTGSGHD